MAQEILKIKILYPKTSKQFHQISEKYNEQKLFNKKAVLKAFAKFTGKHLCQRVFFKLNYQSGHQSVTLLKRDSNTGFLVRI